MHRGLSSLSLCAAACLLSVTFQPTLIAQESQSVDYQEPDFSNSAPVKMEIFQNGGETSMGTHDVQPSSEGVEIEMLEGGGAIVVGWDHMDQFTMNFPITGEVERALAHPVAEERVKQLEKHVIPLLPFASVSVESTNVHDLIDAYIQALIESKDWLRGYEISQYMALNRSPSETVQYLYSVAENLFLIGEQEKALTLIDQLTAARPADEFRSFGLGVAERMLDMRLFEPALRLFGKIAESTTGMELKKMLLTSAYLCLELGTNEEADQFLAKAKKLPESDDETVGIEYLCAGVKAFLRGDSDLSLNELGHAMALLPNNSKMQQVGLYYTYLSYWNKGKPEIATNILDEMGMLFPDGAYFSTLNANKTQ
jgi:hypothetical protein